MIFDGDVKINKLEDLYKFQELYKFFLIDFVNFFVVDCREVVGCIFFLLFFIGKYFVYFRVLVFYFVFFFEFFIMFINNEEGEIVQFFMELGMVDDVQKELMLVEVEVVKCREENKVF